MFSKLKQELGSEAVKFIKKRFSSGMFGSISGNNTVGSSESGKQNSAHDSQQGSQQNFGQSAEQSGPSQSQSQTSPNTVLELPMASPISTAQHGNQQPGGYFYFRHVKCHRKRKTLLIGINYFGTKGELRGCINDVQSVQEWLFRFYPQFSPSSGGEIVILTDDQKDVTRQPTRSNIIQAMRWLVSNAQPNDAFFLHFSGHGSTQKDMDGDEVDGQDETILPVDYSSAGVITDDELHTMLLQGLPQGCRFTAIFDSCHSGSILDLPYTYTIDGNLEVHEVDNTKIIGQHAIKAAISYATGNKKQAISEMTNAAKAIMQVGKKDEGAQKKQKETRTTQAFVSMFSGSLDNQTSADACIAGQHAGAMSWGLKRVMENHQGRPVPYVQVLKELRENLKGKYSQIPQLSAGFHTDMNQSFLLY